MARGGSRTGCQREGVALPARLERATPGLGNQCSIRLSYGSLRGSYQSRPACEQPEAGAGVFHRLLFADRHLQELRQL